MKIRNKKALAELDIAPEWVRHVKIDSENSCWICKPRRGENARWNYRRGWRSKNRRVK